MIKAVLFIFCALFVCVILKNVKSSLPLFVSAFSSFAVCIFSLTIISPAVEFVDLLAQSVELNNDYLKIIFKCVAICFLCNICTNICKDTGENTLAYGAEVVCRFTIISVTLPIYMDVFNWIVKLWESI